MKQWNMMGQRLTKEKRTKAGESHLAFDEDSQAPSTL